MVFGPSGRDHGDFGPQNNSKQNATSFLEKKPYYVGKSHNIGNCLFERLGKDGGPKNAEDPCNTCSGNLNMGSISSRKMNWELLEILDVGQISSRKHELRILENVGYGINIYQKQEMNIL